MTKLNKQQITHIQAAIAFSRGHSGFHECEAFKVNNTRPLTPMESDQLLQLLSDSGEIEVHQSGLRLNDKCQVLLHRACKTVGSYNPSEIMCYIEEELTSSESDLICDFLNWLAKSKWACFKSFF